MISIPKKIDETGNRYGRWTVLREATKEETNGRKGGTFWKCRCDCGNDGVIAGFSLRNGDSSSCGCYNKEMIAKIGREKLFIDRTGKENHNYQNYIMKIIKYNSANDIIVEFEDIYKAKVHCNYKEFINGLVKNPYHPEVYGVGMIGNKYSALKNGEYIREYKIWHSILQRCYDKTTKEKQPTYLECIVADEWKFYDNFYDWIHSQSNYDKWKNGERWAIDKDIIKKWNKIYEPEFCSLVPERINALFTRRQNDRGDYPIGVYYYKKGNCFRSQCMNPILNKRVLIGSYNNPTDAFYAYKEYKEDLIKKIANEEYKNERIVKQCYEAMMNYKVEITD